MQAMRNFVAVTLGVTCSLLAVSPLIQPPASARGKESRAAFYLTPGEHLGNQALTACAAGFHMASLWEIFGPSTLRYDATLGHPTADAGNGPPAGVLGWVRTGSVASVSQFDTGSANCNVWTATEPFHGGTVVSLSNHWDSPSESSSPWKAFVFSCTATFRVWCVED